MRAQGNLEPAAQRRALHSGDDRFRTGLDPGHHRGQDRLGAGGLAKFAHIGTGGGEGAALRPNQYRPNGRV